MNDTANWTLTSSGTQLSRTVPWVSASFLIEGRTSPGEAIMIDPATSSGTTATGPGYSINNPGMGAAIPSSDPEYSSLAGALHPAVTRFGVVSVGSAASWNSATGVAKFNFTNYDATVNFSRSIGADTILTVPVGSWGDGNLLPTGMPLDASLPVPYGGVPGYFPTLAAYASYVSVLVNHTQGSGETIRYWDIGNEVPLINATEVAAYIARFNVASATIHATFPSAQVGTDSMMNQTFFHQFAMNARGVGFLSFHYYPAVGVCVQHGQYCPPTKGSETPDPGVFAPYTNIANETFFPPTTAQDDWYNLTGAHLPVLVTESNLNGAGPGGNNSTTGTDPRIQTLVGAAWLVDTLIQSSQQNVSAFNYFMLSGPNYLPSTPTSRYGGWGFGLSSEGTRDNDTRYAPYWAMGLWGQAFAGHAPGVVVSHPDSGVYADYAARNGSGVSLIIANEVDVPVRYHVGIAGTSLNVTSVRILDSKSYNESYVPSLDRVVLGASSVRTVSADSNAVNFTLDGYGVALVQGQPATGGGTTNTSGGGPNGTSGGGNGTSGSGNGTSGAGNGTSSPPGGNGTQGNLTNGTGPANRTQGPGGNSTNASATDVPPPPALGLMESWLAHAAGTPSLWGAGLIVAALLVGAAALRSAGIERKAARRPV